MLSIDVLSENIKKDAMTQYAPGQQPQVQMTGGLVYNAETSPDEADSSFPHFPEETCKITFYQFHFFELPDTSTDKMSKHAVHINQLKIAHVRDPNPFQH